MSDTVKKLRSFALKLHNLGDGQLVNDASDTMGVAAIEIEKMRAENERLRAENEELRETNKQLVYSIDAFTDGANAEMGMLRAQIRLMLLEGKP